MGDIPAAGSVRSSSSVKQLRNVKRPRPLKLVPSQLEDVLDQIQLVEAELRDKVYHREATKRISRLSKVLKEHGAALESFNKVGMLHGRNVRKLTVKPGGQIFIF
jgi:hypothetical protein